MLETFWNYWAIYRFCSELWRDEHEKIVFLKIKPGKEQDWGFLEDLGGEKHEVYIKHTLSDISDILIYKEK